MFSTEDSVLATGEIIAARFSAADYVVFCAMLVASVAIGVYSAVKSRGKETIQDFLLGGRKMSPYPVAMSLLGGIFSAISILGNPTEVYFFGGQVVMTLLGVVPGSLLVHQAILPIFYNLKYLSLNEYVEHRFNSTVLRKLALMCNLITQFFYMGLYLYAPALALSTVTGLSTWGSMITMGTVCTFYITIGGVKAVVYSDVLQTLLMLGGVLVVVVVCCAYEGLANIWTAVEEGGRVEVFNMDPSPYVRHTFWSTSVMGFYITTYVLGLNQACYQRFAAVSTLQVAQRLVLFFMVGMTGLWFLFYASGWVAYAMYRDCDPLTAGLIEKPDQILPYLVMDKLGHLVGLPGLFVAAVYGGVLSSLSTAGNTIACLIWEDLLQPLPFFARMSNTASTAVCKLLSAVAGVSGIFLGMLAGELGNVFHVTKSVMGAVLGPMQGIFITGIWAPWVNAKGVVVGFLTAFCYNLWLVVGNFYWGGGFPEKLPLSIAGCSEAVLNFLNTTRDPTLSSLDATPDPITLLEDLYATTTTADSLTPFSEKGEKSMYDISYCYFGIIGIIITTLVSSIVSLCTGPVPPQDIDPRLVSPTCLRFYTWLWGVFCASGNKAVHIDTSEEEVSIAMLPNDTAKQPILVFPNHTAMQSSSPEGGKVFLG